MGKASSNKKVTRAASTGGGRTTRGRTPWLWYLSILLVVALGLAGIVQSRHQREIKLAAGTLVPPRLQNPKKHRAADHWHMAYGFYLCDHFAPNLPSNPEKGGIHTHDDGLIHVEPIAIDDTGSHATIGRFVKLAGVTLSATTIHLPGDKAYNNGDKCGDKPGLVQAQVDGKLVDGDPKNIRIKDGSNITIAFVPKGTKIPETPSVANLKDPNANEAGSTPPSTVAPGTETPTSTPAGSTPPASTPPTTPPPAGSTPPTTGGSPATTTPGSPPTSTK
ncbi:MAG: hypothetical protein QOG64_1635 [Acidimicrobiaceae bacterium]|nr:hypothetical protein [Acidimicrobiaceae bacterium]